MAMKSPRSENPHPLIERVRRLIKAPAALSIIWPALLIVGGYLAWHHWGADHVADRFYVVDPSLIEITQPPPYVRTDVVESIYQDTAMEGLSLLDPQATAKIAAAFSMHAWVRRVVSVRKLPGGVIDVHLLYRKPVAMVLVEKPDQGDSQDYFFFPVDDLGVLLPTHEFARAEIMQFIHIVVPGVYATGSAGSPFGDVRVESAAKLAAVLADFREEAGVVSIDVPGDPRINKTPQLELTTTERLASGEVVTRKRYWGSPPGAEPPGESTVEMKLHTLLNSDASEHADLRIALQSTPGPDVESEIRRPQTQATPTSARTAPAWTPQGKPVSPIR